MRDICQRFKDNVQLDHNFDIFYSYNGKVGINEELTFEEIANQEDRKINKMNILVNANEKVVEPENSDLIKSKNIICPLCKEYIKMDIKDFKINLYECKNRHAIKNILLNEFEESQKIDRLKIICDICKTNNKSISENNEFYIYNKCHMNICPKCKINHDQSHKLINYDDKYYICDEHNEKFLLYCEECKMNICSLCEKHKYHKKILFDDILFNKEELLKKSKDFKNHINLLNQEIKMIINIFNEVLNNLDIYYKINEDIINNYNDEFRNYETIYYLKQFQKNNITEDLKKVIDSYTITDKFNNIFNIYSKMNIDEIELVYAVKDKKEVELFGETFAEKYKGKCKLIIDGQEEELKSKHIFGKFFGTTQEILKIKLKGITNILDMSGMFHSCSSLVSVPDIDRWNTDKIRDMNSIFCWCSSLPVLPDISKWNTSKVKNMNSLFSKCISLLYLPDISKWDISNVEFMSCIFKECTSLTSLPDISKWKTSNVLDMSDMFNKCKSLLYLPDISKWDTSNVKYMNSMFRECISLTSLPDISKWNIYNLQDKKNMFSQCNGSLKIPPQFN